MFINDLGGRDLGGRDLGGRDLGGRDLKGRDLRGRYKFLTLLHKNGPIALVDYSRFPL